MNKFADAKEGRCKIFTNLLNPKENPIFIQKIYSSNIM